MNNLQVINGVNCYEENGTAYLRLEDVARGLGFTTVATSGNEVVRWSRVRKYLSEFGCIDTSVDGYIPENIFYRLAMKAKNETAERFQALVADEIIPSIRKHGGYIAGQENLTSEQILANAVLLAQSVIAEKDNLIKQQEQMLAEYEPKVTYHDLILQTPDLLSVSQIAKDYGKSAQWLNEKLKEFGVQYKQGGVWLLRQEHASFGYTKSKTGVYNDNGGNAHSKLHTYWTQKGRLFIYDLLKQHGYLPLIEQV